MRRGLRRLLSLGVISALVLSLVLPTNVAYADEVSTEIEVANAETATGNASVSDTSNEEQTKADVSEVKNDDADSNKEDIEEDKNGEESEKSETEDIDKADKPKNEDETKNDDKQDNSEEIKETEAKETVEKADEAKEETKQDKSAEIKEPEKKPEVKAEETKTETKQKDSEKKIESEETELESEEETEEVEENVEAVLGETETSMTITTDTVLEADTVVNGDLYVQNEQLKLNGYTLEVSGDVIITGGRLWMYESQSQLIVHGKIQIYGDDAYYSNSLISNGKIVVDGNFEILSGSQEDYTPVHCSGECSIGGDLFIDSAFFYWGAEQDNFGILNLKGDFIDKTGIDVLPTINLVGNTTHVFDMVENSSIRLKPNSESISVVKNFSGRLYGDAVIENQDDKIVSSFIILEGCSMTVPCTLEVKDYISILQRAKLNVSGDLLCPVGRIASDDVGECWIDGDLIFNESSDINISPGLAPTLYLKGNYIDMIGGIIYPGRVNMTVKGKTITTSGGKINILHLAGSRNDYNITTPNCWNTIYETVVAGWKQDKNGWWYLNADGTYPKSAWKEIGGKWYRFNANGYMQTGWILDGGRWYYLESSGVMATSKWVDNVYYVKANGVMAVNEWVNDKYYVGADGRWVPGKQKLVAGWKQDKTGWWYQNSDGSYPRSAWKEIGGKWYHFNASGYMQTGWIYVNSYWFFLESSGAMATSRWVEDKYFIKANGAMAVSEWVDGGKYYVDGNGVWVRGKTR